MTTTTMTSRARAELSSAEVADDVAKEQALQRGLIATLPLTATRLAELCALGEAMMRTGLRRRAAVATMGAVS